MIRTRQLLAVLLTITLVASVGLVATGGFVGAQTQQDGTQENGAASVTITDQPSDGETVVVDNVTVPEGGFVVIHDADELEDGQVVESVIGVSTYLEPGTHDEVPVTVATQLDSAEVEVTAMPHRDTNDNQVYDFVTSEGELDGPYTTGDADEAGTPAETETVMTETEAETETEMTETETEVGAETETETEIDAGTETETETEGGIGTETEAPEVGTPTEAAEAAEPVTDTATIDAVGNNVPDTNLEFSDQSSNGTTVTVDRVTLYRGGYVVIHDTSELEGGDAVGSVIGHSQYLPPGTYEDVTVTLAEPLDVENESSVNVTAMPHFETNQNLAYDFVISLGSEDEPYTENGTAVAESATITAGDGDAAEAPTETEAGTETETETETEMGTETETGASAGAATTTEGA